MILALQIFTNDPVVLFDGECVLCNRSVRFIHRYDRTHRLKFASLQSGYARTRLQQCAPNIIGTDSDTQDSIVLIDAGGVHVRSNAVLRIAAHLRQPWRGLGAAAWLLPRFLRDGVYRLVARYRYHWFGRLDACPVPPPDLASRMVGTTDEDAE